MDERLAIFLEGVRKDCGRNRNLFEAVSRAAEVLFEDAEGSASHKTRRVIRKLFPQLGAKLDETAVDENGKPLLTASGKEQKFIDMLEHRVRNEFFHDGSNIRFEPGVARIAYGELHMEDRNEESRQIADLKKIVKLISDGHASEYDSDLNGMSFADLTERFGSKVQVADEEEKNALKNAQYEKSDYVIEKIPDYESATRYAAYTDPNPWCITHMETMWNSYTMAGMNNVYFCHKPGFENLKPVKGQNCPLDEYGLSLISVIVDPWENLRAVTTRWNHANGGSDQAMDAKELSRILGGNVFDLCPPPPKPEQQIKRIGNNAVQIGSQVWMDRNLDIDDGGAGIIRNPDHPEYGCYYTWEAACRVAESVPGWHLPTQEEWDELADAVGKTAKTGALLKSTSGWDDGGNGFDTYGFAALPAGYHYCDNFSKYGYYAAFWTASELNSKCAFYRYFCTDASIDLEYGGKNVQYSVRLVRDS